MLLKDKVIIVTGAASKNGIGKATAKMLCEQGAKVAILDLDSNLSQEAAAELGLDNLGLVCDVTNPEQCQAAAKAVFDKYGKIDGLINNAGITQPVKTLGITPESFNRIVDVNLNGSLYMSQAVIPFMQKAKNGSIVCISSVSAQRGGGIFGGPHYSAAKAGVLGLAKAMAREFGPDNIRINSITPGLIQTDITQGKLSDEMKADIIKGIPLNRLGDAQDVGGACLYLLSDLAKYLTGTTLDVNGGMLIH